MSTSIAVIPARSGSKGIQDKNVVEVEGHPLMAYSIVAAKKIASIDRVIVSTDSAKYAEIAQSYGAEVPFLRPAAISGDKSTDLEWVLHLLEWLEMQDDSMPQFIVHLRPTTPIREPAIIDNAIKKFCENPKATSLRSVQQMSQTAYKYFEISGEVLLTIFDHNRNIDAANLPRAQYPLTYEPNGYVDILKPAIISDEGKLHGDHSLAFITPVTFDIDTLYELDLLKSYLKSNKDTALRSFED